MTDWEQVPLSAAHSSEKTETRGRPKNVLVICENRRNASFIDHKGNKVRPGETAEVPANLAEKLVHEAQVARYANRKQI